MVRPPFLAATASIQQQFGLTYHQAQHLPMDEFIHLAAMATRLRRRELADLLVIVRAAMHGDEQQLRILLHELRA